MAEPQVAKETEQWRGYGADWEVHKFGGASLETAALYKTCGDLLRSEAAKGEGPGGQVPTAAIVSAAGGMTDALVSVVTASVSDLALAEEKLREAEERQIGILLELVPGRPDLTDPAIENIKQDGVGVLAMLRAVSMLRGVPPQVLELVAGLGEVWSAQTLSAYLKSTGAQATWVDARDVLMVPDVGSGAGLGEKGTALETITPLWEHTESLLSKFWTQDLGVPEEGAPAPFLIITGFVCTTPSGRPTTLKRSGSDYSATIFAKVLGSSRVTMWKNVDGVYTADPRRVPAAFPISRMTFDEAMELAYFGGQVLHPSAMIPCIEKRIPVYVRNVFNPSHPGTRVYGRGDDLLRWPDQEDEDDDVDDFPVKAITSIEKVALVTLAGASFLGTPGVARRMMEALGNAGVNVILTSQGSSEHSITVAVDESEGQQAYDAVSQAFALELASEQEIRVTTKDEVSIMAVIGEGMKSRTGIGGRFFNALGRAKVNVIAIAQGASERNISAVIPRRDLSRALRAAHAGFTLSEMTVAVAIIGSGKVGTELLRQLDTFQQSGARNTDLPAMADVKRLNIQVRAICDEDMMILAEHGVPLDMLCKDKLVCDGAACKLAAWSKAAQADGKELMDLLQKEDPDNEFKFGETDLAALEKFMDTRRIPHNVLIDCTASSAVASNYPRWLKRGLHVISPNKKAPAGPLEQYKECMMAAGPSQSQWRYESTVGGQMPVISLTHDILQTGDELKRVRGVFSGTMSYLFNRLTSNTETTLSETVSEAVEQGLAEPDPREDLSGRDTARKAVIIAREMGLNVSMADVQVESLLPESAEVAGADLAAELKAGVDEQLAARLKKASAAGAHLVYVADIDAEAGTVSVGPRALPGSDPLASVREAETAVTFETARYPADRPLVVRGPGAGAVVTASGVFADLLRLSKTLGS